MGLLTFVFALSIGASGLWAVYILLGELRTRQGMLFLPPAAAIVLGMAAFYAGRDLLGKWSAKAGIAPEVTREAALLERPLIDADDLLGIFVHADTDAACVTTRDGRVVFANGSYRKMVEQTGLECFSVSIMPPARFFDQHNAARKLYALLDAARAGGTARTSVALRLGQKRQCFHVNLCDADRYLYWRLHAVDISEDSGETWALFKAMHAPVLGFDRFGMALCANTAALKECTDPRGLYLADIALGESAHAWQALCAKEEVTLSLTTPEGRARTLRLRPFYRAEQAWNEGSGAALFAEILRDAPESKPVAEETSATAARTGVGLHQIPCGAAAIELKRQDKIAILDCNAQFSGLLSVKTGENLLGALDKEAAKELAQALRRKNPRQQRHEMDLRAANGLRTYKVVAVPQNRQRGRYGARVFHLFVFDMSLQKRLENDVGQDQKLKAIGQLAGGIAHDFNNILQVMLGHCELLLRNHPIGDPSYEDLSMIRQNAVRASSLTRKLLAFSRKQTLRNQVVSLPDTLAETTRFLTRILSEKIKLKVIHGTHVPPIFADPIQLDVVLMNLAVNARDAMKDGGVFTLTTAYVRRGELANFLYSGFDKKTDYVVIEARDTGAGIDESMREKIFEPYFTTKELGKGTGLGLSTVHGIMGQMGGAIFLARQTLEQIFATGEVPIKPESGAVFHLFFPVYEAKPASLPVQKKATRHKSKFTTMGGTGSILIIEDENAVRHFVMRALSACGYDVLEAGDAEEATEIINSHAEGFDLIISDIMMPDMDGPSLIRSLRDKLSKAHIMFMSGYAEDSVKEKMKGFPNASYMQKPFSVKKMAEKVKSILSDKQTLQL